MNRAAKRVQLFDANSDYIAVEGLLLKAKMATGIRLLDYCMEQTFSGSIIDYLHAQSIDPATVGIQIIQLPQRTERTEQTPR